MLHPNQSLLVKDISGWEMPGRRVCERRGRGGRPGDETALDVDDVLKHMICSVIKNRGVLHVNWLLSRKGI